jgi:hypothetical protein
VQAISKKKSYREKGEASSKYSFWGEEKYKQCRPNPLPPSRPNPQERRGEEKGDPI